MSDMTPQQCAEYVRDGLLKKDRATHSLGIAVLSIGPGHATLSMQIREDMLNGHATCHGGFMATLADSAFAFACNSYNELTVASGFNIDFLAPGRLDDCLTEQCVEVSRVGRTGIYDTAVTNQRGERVAFFRGRSHTVKGTLAVGPA